MDLEHTHRFRRDSGLQVVLEQEGDEFIDSNQEFQRDLLKAATRYISTESISAAAACSSNMRRFILDVIRVSHRFFSVDRVFNPEEILTNFSPRVMRDEIKALGERVFDTVTGRLAEFKFVNVMIDAGSMLNRSYVHVTISNPYSSQKPLPFDLFIKDGPTDWSAQDYYEALEAQVARLISLRKRLIPVAVCHDRLLCQSLAVRRLVEVLAEGDNGIVVVDCPCLNHLLNTVFTHTLDMPGLKVIVKKIGALATHLRKRDAVFHLKRHCPYPPKTRWLYLCDTLAFLYQHKDAIISYFLQRSDGATVKSIRAEYLPLIFDELYLILLPLKQLSLCFEEHECRLADAIPLLNITFELFSLVLTKISADARPILVNIVKEMRTLFQLHLPVETWACWAMTRHGRAFLRARNAPPGLCTDFLSASEDEVRTSSGNDLHARMKQEVLRVLENYKSETEQEIRYTDPSMPSGSGSDHEDDSPLYEPEGCISDEDDELSLEKGDEDSDDCWIDEIDGDFDTSRVSDEDAEVNQKEDELRNELSTLSLDSLLGPTWAENTYSRSLEVLQKYYTMATGNDSDESNAHVMSLFDVWLGLISNPLSAYFTQILRQDCSDITLWQHAFKCDELKEFAVIAMKLITVAVGESDVERLFSRQRRLVGTTMTNIGRDVLLSRLRISSADSEIVMSE